MTFKKSHTAALVILGAFFFAYLSSGSSSKTPIVKENIEAGSIKEPTSEENKAPEQNPIALGAKQPNFAPSYVPRIIPPGSRPQIGPTPGIIGEPIDVNSDSYNPYAELTEMMKKRREEQGANTQVPADNSQRNLYFETLSNQLKELQGQGDATIEQDGHVEAQAGPTSAPGISATNGFSNGVSRRKRNNAEKNLVAPVDPAPQNEVIDEPGSGITEEELNQIIDDEGGEAGIEDEIDRVLEEEGLLD